MQIKINQTSMEILRKHYKHLHLSESQVDELVQYSWSKAEEQSTHIYDENGTAVIFCLCAENRAGNAVFLYVMKNATSGTWLGKFAYFRAPGTQHPQSDKDPFNAQLFKRFPTLEERLEEISDMRLLSWQSQTAGDLAGPPFEDLYDVVYEGVVNSFEGYSSRIYEPSAFGFSKDTQIEIIMEKLRETYEGERANHRVFECGSYLGCRTDMTNANREYLYMIVSVDDDDYRAEICPFSEIESTFHGDASAILKEISLLPWKAPKSVSLLWRFSRFTQIRDNFWGVQYIREYSDLYKGEGASNSVRLLAETWSFDNPDDVNDEIRCLGDYLEGTFLRLLYEYKFWILDGSRKRTDDPDRKCFAVFNTGLVDIAYRPIYMIFKWSYNKWVVDSFRTVGNGILNGKDVAECPPKADYICGDILRTIYCTDENKVFNWRTPKTSDDHIYENFSRLPESVQKYCLGDKYQSYTETNDISLVKAMPNENRLRLLDSFKRALEVAISRAAWNMRTGVPVYYYKDGSVNVLLPLAMQTALDYVLAKVDSVDATSACDTAALMVLTRDYDQTGEEVLKYECKTLFSLSMAYRDARLINRPESDWLTPII